MLGVSLPSLHGRDVWKGLTLREPSLGFSVNGKGFANGMVVKLEFSPLKHGLMKLHL